LTDSHFPAIKFALRLLAVEYAGIWKHHDTRQTTAPWTRKF
jgi:hypothetical protein